MNDEIVNEQGLGLGIAIIIILVILGIAPFLYGFETGPIKKGHTTIFTGIYMQTWGCVFLLSYFYSHKTFFFRALIWLCENLSRPKGKFMAILYFLLFFGIGSMAVIKGI